MSIAHRIGERPRTDDIVISESVDFSGLLLSKNVLCGLQNAGFERPSPIQLKAIPLGRCGLDLIVQAKSGTGKTCVFSVIALETLQVQATSTQVLVLAPTREVAIQIWEVIGSLGSAMPGLRCHTFIGGMPVHEDRKKLQLCHIAVGTPGRIQNLIETGSLKTDSIRLFVLDEADKLLEDSFQETINWIYSALPENKQMLALSATYPESMAQHLTLYMRNPTFIRLNVSDPTLLGIKQYFAYVPNHPLPNKVFDAKTAVVVNLLSSVTFHQCLIFSNMQTRAQNLESDLTSQGWPTACIAGSLDQKDRIAAMAKLKTYQCRVLISTDLTSRGIDADKVNLVINLDVPKDHETYLHRIGRAGRFGSYGAAVTIISEGQELLDLQLLQQKISTYIQPLPDPVPSDLVQHQLKVNLDDVVSTEQLISLPKVKGPARTESGSGSEVLTALQSQSRAETDTVDRLDSQNSGSMEEKGQADFSIVIMKNDVDEHNSYHKESGCTKLSHTLNDVLENDVLGSVLPAEQEWPHTCTNSQIVATGSCDLKSHSCAKVWMNADGQIASKTSDTDCIECGLVLEKQHEGAVGVPQPVSAASVGAEKEQVIVQEEIKVALVETSGKSEVASSNKQPDNVGDVNSEMGSGNDQTLSEGPISQIKTTLSKEMIYLEEAENEHKFKETCICEEEDKHASEETCLGVAVIQQTAGKNCSTVRLEPKQKTCLGEDSKQPLEKRHFDTEDLEWLAIGERLVPPDQSQVCTLGSEARDQTPEKNMVLKQLQSTAAELTKGEEKVDVSCGDKSTDQSRLDASGIAADGDKIKCNKVLPNTGTQDETNHHNLVRTSLPEMMGGGGNLKEFNGEASKSFSSYSEASATQATDKMVSKKSQRVSSVAKMWGEMLATDLGDQKKVKGKIVKEQKVKGTGSGKGCTQENSEHRFKQKSKISSGASAVAKLWGEMCTDAHNLTNNNSEDTMASENTETLKDKQSCTNRDDDEQRELPRDSENPEQNQVDDAETMTNQEQKEQRGRGEEGGEWRKSKKEQLSWESELALYVAARAKLNTPQPSNSGEIKESVDISARPQKQARRRHGGGKIKSSAYENCEEAKPENSTDTAAVLLERAQNADNQEEKNEMDKAPMKDAENRTSQNPRSKHLVKVGSVPNNAAVKESSAGTFAKTSLEGRRETEKTDTTADEGHQSRDKTEVEFDSGVALKEPNTAEMSGSLGSASSEGALSSDHGVDIQGHADVSVSSVLPRSCSQTHAEKGGWRPFPSSVATELSHILARLPPQTTRFVRDPHTYSSALQDYSRFVEQGSIPEPPSTLDIVNKTFKSSGGAVAAEDLTKISKFLDDFHHDVQYKVLSEKPAMEEFKHKISSFKEDLVDKAVQTEHSSSLNCFELEDSEVSTFKSELCVAVASSGKDRMEVNSSSHDAERDLESRGSLVSGPVKVQTAVLLQREQQTIAPAASSSSCVHAVSPAASSGGDEQKFDRSPGGATLEKYGNKKHLTAKATVESRVQNEKLPPTGVATKKSSCAPRQGSNILSLRHRGDGNETLKDRRKHPAKESGSDTVPKGNNLSPKVCDSDKQHVKQQDFRASEAEESSLSSSNTSSFSSDNEETAAAENPDDRSTVFYKNRYTHEPTLPRRWRVPPKLREAERSDPNKHHWSAHKSKNVGGGCSSDAKTRHQASDFFPNHVSPDQSALNSWRAWYAWMQSGYPNAPVPTVYQTRGRPFAQMAACLNPSQVNFPHYDSTMHQLYHGSTPWPAGAYFLENKNSRCSQKPCYASSTTARQPGALSVQSVWSKAKSQQEYIKQMAGFYRDLARHDRSSPRS